MYYIFIEDKCLSIRNLSLDANNEHSICYIREGVDASHHLLLWLKSRESQLRNYTAP
jgi:hypothetical protein